MQNSGHGFSEGGEFKKFSLLKDHETTATGSTEGSEPIKLTEQERIEKEATEYVHNCARQFADKPSYLVGAKNEYKRFFETKTEMGTVIESLKIELKQRDETIKELREALGDVMIIIENSPELWLIESQWNIIDKARKLVTE